MTPSHATPGMEEALLDLDHLLGRMLRAREQQEDALRAQLERLQPAIASNGPRDAGDARTAEALGYCIRECAEWQRNHQQAAEQYLNAIQVLAQHVQGLQVPPTAPAQG